MMRHKMRHKLPRIAVLISALVLVGAIGINKAAAQETEYRQDIADPLEGYNRAMFQFNDALDQAIAEPVARGYKAAVPRPGRKGVRNFLRNLNSPIFIANQALQGDLEGAGDAITRALVNTFIGLGGLIDVAGHEDIEYEKEDFGQTLAVWGVGSGPYIVVPFMGPANMRDHIGSFVDTYADPIRWWLFNTDQEEWYYARLGAGFLDRRVQLLDVLDDLQSSSIDYYASVRSTTQQRRAALIRDEEPDDASLLEIPDYDE